MKQRDDGFLMKIGVISDTHNFFDGRIPQLFAGVEHILHAGDIGLPSILHELETIAPVTAVSGNTDDPGLNYRLTQTITLAGRKFLLHHIVNPHALEDELESRIRNEQSDIVVFGHTHKPFFAELDGTIYLNPGYAGKSRFGLERSLAILHLKKDEVRPQFLPL